MSNGTAPGGACELMMAGERLLLLPQRALFLPERELLVVADVHFGKGAAFRSWGIPVPAGTTGDNLAALDTVLETSAASHLLFLGDFLHARSARSPMVLSALQEWRERHTDLRITLVRGNHDRHAGDPPGSLRIDVVEQPFLAGDLALRHEPAGEDARVPALAGHLHPVCRVTHGHESVRLPCFLLRAQELILPAFGAFTGGHLFRPQPNDRIYLVTPEAVLPLPD